MPSRTIKKKFHGIIRRAKYAGRRRGVIGRVNTSGQIEVRDNTIMDRNHVFVTFNNDPRDWDIVLCVRFKQQANVHVWVERNIHKELEVVDLVIPDSIETFGDAMPDLFAPDQTGALDRSIYNDRNLGVGRVHASQAGGMFVTVEPFDWDGGWWPGGDLDLTAFRPATASKKAWVVVCLKTSDNTLTAITGTEYPLTTSLTHTELAAITITAGYIPLWGWVLQNGQTSLSAATQNEPIRYWLDKKGGGSALTVKEIDGTPTVTNVTTIRVTNGTLTDDGSGQVTVATGGGSSAVTEEMVWIGLV